MTDGSHRLLRRANALRSARRPRRESAIGALLATPALIGLLVFIAIPIAITIWVSFRDWSGFRSPFDTKSVRLSNYRDLLVDDTFRRSDFARSVRNNLYYVLGVVPAQTVAAFLLAVFVNNRMLRGRGLFRTAYYFPAVTSSVATSLMFLFLFQTDGVINALLPGDGIEWLNNPNGLIHNALGAVGIERAPSWAASTDVLGLSVWDWFAGPSVAMTAIMLLVIWSTTGTMMLIFLGALQNLPVSVEEAALIDGASDIQRLRWITVPMMRPTIAFVVTLGLIATWQVFDQIFVISQGDPRGTTTTPAYEMYANMFQNSRASAAAAIAVLLFVVIIGFTAVQRRVQRSGR
jgi:multiple sugar transport system permease protein